MKIQLKHYLVGLCVMALPTAAQTLLPQPQHVQWQKGYFDWQKPYRMECSQAVAETSAPVQQWMPTKAVATDSKRVVILEKGNPAWGDEEYQIYVSADTVKVGAKGEAGFLAARATLAQLTADGTKTRAVVISDSPAYRYRGAMLDVSRHFYPMEFVKKQVDLLARYKFNRLHLHLTDAAGWRMEIKRYPRLTNFAAWRTDSLWKTWWDGERKYVEEGTPGAYGGYYTQSELRDLVDYALERGITIIPEIEMPAHSEEVLTAYPCLSCTHEPYKQADFCPGSVSTYDFLENVLKEVMDVFPSAYIHVGGDEAAKASWSTCPRCQAKMEELGTTDVNDLQTHLIAHMGRFLKSHGRTLIGWDEVIDGNLEKGTTVMVWRGLENATRAAEHGYDVILSPGAYCYFDAYQDSPADQPEAMGAYLPLKKVYSFVPGENMSPANRAHIVGVQANLWTEHVPSAAHAEYMIWPRLLAIAEIGWNGTKEKNYEEFHQRAMSETQYLRVNGVNAFDLKKEKGDRVQSPIKHKAVGATVIWNRNYHRSYPGNGPTTLTDGKLGGWNYGDKPWLGFLGKDCFDITVDLGKVQSISEVGADFLQCTGPWIYFPGTFKISVSADGKEYQTLFQKENPDKNFPYYKTEWWTWKGKAKARYIRLQGDPVVHGGWIFVDEIIVK